MTKTMTMKGYAQHRGVVRSTVTKWRQKNLIVMKGSCVDVAGSDAILDAMEQHVEDGQDPKNTNEALFLKEKYLAKIRRLEYREKSGQFVKETVVKSALTDIFSQHRDGLLTIPERLSAQLALETDQVKVREMLSAEIRGHLDGLADRLEGK